MTKKRKPAKPTDQKAQSKRFVEKARELGVDESGEAFERAFNKIIRQKKQQKCDHTH